MTVRPVRIAISGKSGSGKSTLARELSRLLDARVLSFAAPLKDGLRAMGVLEDGDPTNRPLLQGIASVIRSVKGPDTFVELMDRQLSRRFRRANVIIDDLRYLNEYEWCRENGFFLVRLRGSFRALTGPEAEHESETALDGLEDDLDWDLVLGPEDDVPTRVSAVQRGWMEWSIDPDYYRFRRMQAMTRT
jgi:energy-coupling factor transporter ATP-binding protein EcfA2